VEREREYGMSGRGAISSSLPNLSSQRERLAEPRADVDVALAGLFPASDLTDGPRPMQARDGLLLNGPDLEARHG
jgi:hypothetical protein